MSDTKKYYYLKLKEYFFDSNEISVIQGIDDGYKYICILLKMYLKSLKYAGKLMLNDKIPYSVPLLSKVLHHTIADIEMAIQIFIELGLIEKIDEAYYMTDIQNFIGKSSSEADRKREYRALLEEKRQMSDKSPPKIETDKKNKELYQDVFNLYTKNCTNLKPLTKVLYEERINLLNELLQNFTLNEIEKRLPKSQYNAFFDWR